MSKQNEHIDDLFKDAFENWEDMPKSDLWQNISEDLDNTSIDEIFRDALSTEEITPSDKVWEGVRENLPLNLWLKRKLNTLSYVAGILVVCMLATLYFMRDNTTVSIPEDNPIAIQPIEEKPSFNIQIAIEEIETITEVKKVRTKKTKKTNAALATDNTIDEKMQSVELNDEDKWVFDIDEEKMKAILQPVEPLPIDSSIARVNGKNNNAEREMESEEESILPENLEDILPAIGEE